MELIKIISILNGIKQFVIEKVSEYFQTQFLHPRSYLMSSLTERSSKLNPIYKCIRVIEMRNFTEQISCQNASNESF